MKKSDILDRLEEKFDYLPKREVERTLEKVLQFFSANLAKGNRIEIRDFGTFSLRLRKSRVGRNPSSGKKIECIFFNSFEFRHIIQSSSFY